MKTILRIIFRFSGILSAIMWLGLSSCTNEDQILEPETPIGGNDLISIKVANGPTIDGIIDALWENSPKLQFETVVPEPSGDVFRGYVGNIIPSVTLRSAFDADNIYFLAEWVDPTQSLLREPWYFDPEEKLWKQEHGNFTFSSNGTITRGAFYEDKMAMLWNVDNSVSGWNSATCYKSCHSGLPASDGSTRHYTNFFTERIDMWHWKSVRGGTNGGFQFDDQYQDNSYPNGRKSDTGAGAYSDNVQTLNNGISDVKVPKYLIPSRTNYGWILGSEVTDFTAVQITSVDVDGVLYYDGGSIDPNTDVAFQRDGASVGVKSIPGIIIKSYTESRGDITCMSVYTGTGWILEYKRALKTNDTSKQDIDFSSLADQYFGMAIFENAQIAHSIKPNLLLKFKK